MLGNDFVWGLFRPDLQEPTKDDVVNSFAGTNLLPVPGMPPQAVSSMIPYLAFDAGRYATGTTMLLGSGFLSKP